MQTVTITEGNAKLVVPKQSLSSPFHCRVFFNPAMEFNRTLSSLAFGALGLEDAVAVDGLSATGARGIRYAVENKLEKIFFVEANTDAVKLLKQNVKLNKLRNAVVAEDDLNKFLADSEEHFDFIEIDPFGSPVPFLENAVKKLKTNGVLSVTATDLANLCGANALPCVRHYDSVPLHSEYLHETAARILVGRIARTARAYDFGVTPLLTFYERHYVKTVVRLEKSAAKADAITKSLGFISHCFSCMERAQGWREKCVCGKKMRQAGPLWLDDLSDTAFVKTVRKEAEDKRVVKMLALIEGEQGFPPWFFDLHAIADKFGLEVKASGKVIGKLERKGFKAVKTSFSGKGIKTDAGIKEVRAALA